MLGGEPHSRQPSVEMPKVTIWPMVLSLGLTLIATGVALGTIAFPAIGGLLFVMGLWGWMADLLPGRGHEMEPLTHPLPQPVASRPGTVEPLRPGAAGYRFRLPEKIHPISAGLKGGLVGGLVMPIPALAWGVLSGHGIWFPVNLLAGLVIPGLEFRVDELKQFQPTLFAIALVIHISMSATIGLLNGVILPTLPGNSTIHVICGGVIMPMLWSGFSYGFMRIANPALALYVDWYSFAASQFVFGLAAAIVVVRTEKVAIPPAGHGEPPVEGGQS